MSDSNVRTNLSQERIAYLKKVKLRKTGIWIVQLLILIFFFAFWEVAANLKLIDPFITSQPTRMIKTLINLYNGGDLFLHIGATCLETILGFTIGTILGTIIAILLWWSEFACQIGRASCRERV